MSLVLNVPEFWIYQGSEYASGFEYAKILIIPEFWICQRYTGFRKCLNNFLICLHSLIISGYVWISLNIPEYEGICLNLPECFFFYYFMAIPTMDKISEKNSCEIAHYGKSSISIFKESFASIDKNFLFCRKTGH